MVWNLRIFRLEYVTLVGQILSEGVNNLRFLFQNSWAAEGLESGTKFSDIDLSDKEWVEYDEKAKNEVGIYEIEHQFSREK